MDAWLHEENRLNVHRFVGLRRPYPPRVDTWLCPENRFIVHRFVGLRRPNMPYDPERHHRRSIRLPGYDYTQDGAYFVTLVAANRECLFGDVVDGHVVLSTCGKIVDWFWRDIPRHAAYVRLDAYVVMPNHVHAVLWIANVGATQTYKPVDGGPVFLEESGIRDKGSPGFASPLPDRAIGPASHSVGAIIGNYKSVTTRRINQVRKSAGAVVWQRNYYEHIVRSEEELHRICTYIQNNPAQWASDSEREL